MLVGLALGGIRETPPLTPKSQACMTNVLATPSFPPVHTHGQVIEYWGTKNEVVTPNKQMQLPNSFHGLPVPSPLLTAISWDLTGVSEISTDFF